MDCIPVKQKLQVFCVTWHTKGLVPYRTNAEVAPDVANAHKNKVGHERNSTKKGQSSVVS